ncbi:MAG TPA: YihY/virulence factor BrkB family protein [Acidimicrobiales bacterium]|nr:YihY/virulence factor BrkB family protein [Acidimicrobiales bacterium]
MKEKLDRLGERWKWFGTVLRVQKRYGELNGNYLASSVTLSAFLSIFPLLLFAIAVLGFISAGKPDLAASVTKNLGLTGTAADEITNAIHTAQSSRQVASIVGVVGLLWSGLGLVAAVQYAINAAWQVTGRGWRDKLKGLLWLAGATLLILNSFALAAVINFLPGWAAPLGIVAGLSVNLGLWVWTFKVLGTRDVGWKALLPGAVVAAIGLEVLKALGAFYVPRAVASASALYGTLGVVFAILAWLLFFGRLVVYSAVVNVVRWEEDNGTVTVEIETPKVPGQPVVEATRAGEARPHPAPAAAGV